MTNKIILKQIESLMESANVAMELGNSRPDADLRIMATRIRYTADRLKETCTSAADKTDSPHLEVVVWDMDLITKTKFFCLSDSRSYSDLKQFFDGLWDKSRPRKIVLSVLDESKNYHQICNYSIAC